MKKHILTLLLTVLMALFMMPGTGYATEAGNETVTNSFDGENIYTVEHLKAFAEAVNNGDTYAGKTVTLHANLDLNNEVWTPIGNSTYSFSGTFDGSNHTISNLNVFVDGNYAGLFGKINNGTIKYVTINNATVSGYSYVAAVVGQGYTGTVESCRVTGKIKISGNYMVGGISGQGYAKIADCSVNGDGVGTSYIKAVAGNDEEGDKVGGIVGHSGEGSREAIKACFVLNITIEGSRSVGGIAGLAYQNNTISGCSVSNVTITSNATAEYASENVEAMSIGGLIGIYESYGENDGTLAGDVEDVTLTTTNDVTDISMGYITGGLRIRNSGTEPVEPVISAGITITGTNNGETTNYLRAVKINDTYYSSLTAALTAASDGDTVTLLDDVAASEKIVIDKAITLDLDNYTITGAEEAIVIEITADVTVTGGTVVGNTSGNTNGVIKVTSGALKLDNVTVTHTGTSYIYRALRVQYGASAVLTNCTVTGFISGVGTTEIKSGTYANCEGSDYNVLDGAGIAVYGGTFKYKLETDECADNFKPVYATDAWTVAESTFATDFTINDIYDLELFRNMVNGGDNFSGKTVTLAANIDLSGIKWDPIGKENYMFSGTFDGGNHTISNLTDINGDSNAGLFGYIEYATIKDLTINNVEIASAGTGVGAVVGRAINGVQLNNVKVTGLVKITGLNYVGGIIGYAWSGYTYTECSVDASDESYIKGVVYEGFTNSNSGYTSYIGGLAGYSGPGGKIVGCSVNNIDLSAYYDTTYTAYGIGGLSGMAQYGIVIKDCKVSNVAIDAAELTATGTVAGCNNSTKDSPAWLLDNTVEGVNVTLQSEVAEADIIGTHGFNGSEMVASEFAFIGTGVEGEVKAFTAGKFNADVAAYVAEGYETEANADSTEWTVVKSLFEIELTNMRFGNDLSLLFAFKASALNGTGYYAEIIKSNADGNETKKTISYDAEEWYTTTINNEEYVVLEFDGIAGKEMSDDVKVQVYNSDGTAASKEKISSVRQYAMSRLENSTDDKFKTLIVDMLNYGAAAQTYFSYNADDLANSLLTVEQTALASEAGTYSDVRTAEPTSYFDATNLRFDNNINLLFRLKDITTDMRVEFTYTDHYGDSKTIEAELIPYASDSNLYVVELDELVVADARQVITCIIYDSESAAVCTIQDSVQSYVYRNQGSETGGELYLNFMKFADAAFAYLHQEQSE